MPSRRAATPQRPGMSRLTPEAIGHGLFALALAAVSLSAFTAALPQLGVPLAAFALLAGLLTCCAGREPGSRID